MRFKPPKLPEGSKITSAKLSLYHSRQVTSSATVDVRPVSKSWSSSTITWNQQPTVGSAVSSNTVTGRGWYNFYFTQLETDWMKGTKPNYWVSLRLRNESLDRRTFYSSNYTTDTSLLPKLTIQYTTPPPPKEDGGSLLGVPDLGQSAAIPDR